MTIVDRARVWYRLPRGGIVLVDGHEYHAETFRVACRGNIAVPNKQLNDALNSSD